MKRCVGDSDLPCFGEVPKEDKQRAEAGLGDMIRNPMITAVHTFLFLTGKSHFPRQIARYK